LEISLSGQTLAFLEAILYGALLGAVYDVFKVSRLLFKNKVLVFFEDVVFLLICTVVTFSFLLRVSDGQVRFFIIFGEIIGFILYYFSLSLLVNKIVKGIFKVIWAIFGFLYKLFLRPIGKIFFLFMEIICKIIKKPWILAKKIAISLKFRLKIGHGIMYNNKIRKAGRHKIKKREKG